MLPKRSRNNCASLHRASKEKRLPQRQAPIDVAGGEAPFLRLLLGVLLWRRLH
jgi:hypothetical protein